MEFSYQINTDKLLDVLPEGLASTSRLSLFASTLAWAAENEIPFHRAILSMTESGVLLKTNLTDVFGSSWENSLHAVCNDLANGYALGKTLRKRMRRYLPEYYLQAVEQAEHDGTLSSTLRHFVRRINYSDKVCNIYGLPFVLSFIVFSALMLIISFLLLFIFPKFRKIFIELLDGNPLPKPMEWLELTADMVYQNLLLIILTLAILFVLFQIRFFKVFFIRIIEEILVRVPYVRTAIMQMGMLELSIAVSSYLSRGEDILTAAKFSRKAIGRWWLNRKLDRFTKAVENGENWLDAWSKMNLTLPLNNLLIQNAAVRENIRQGFDNLSDWLYHSIAFTTKRNVVLLWFICFFINAAIVFWIELSVFKTLISIINNIKIW